MGTRKKAGATSIESSYHPTDKFSLPRSTTLEHHGSQFENDTASWVDSS